MNPLKNIVGSRTFKGVVLAAAITGLVAAPTVYAQYYRHYYGHSHWHGYGPGLVIGGAVGLMAGAALASPGYYYRGYYPYNYSYYPYAHYRYNYPYYGYSYYPRYYYPSYGYYGCHRVVLKCYIRHHYYGPYRTCFRVVRNYC
jgi:hypothetical protein